MGITSKLMAFKTCDWIRSKGMNVGGQEIRGYANKLIRREGTIQAAASEGKGKPEECGVPKPRKEMFP